MLWPQVAIRRPKYRHHVRGGLLSQLPGGGRGGGVMIMVIVMVCDGDDNGDGDGNGL